MGLRKAPLSDVLLAPSASHSSRVVHVRHAPALISGATRWTVRLSRTRQALYARKPIGIAAAATRPYSTVVAAEISKHPAAGHAAWSAPYARNPTPAPRSL